MPILTQILDFGVLGEQEVEVTYNYSPGTQDVMYLPNGDPGYPGDPAEFEILDITLDGIRISQWCEGNDNLQTMLFEEAAEQYTSIREERECEAQIMRAEMRAERDEDF